MGAAPAGETVAAAGPGSASRVPVVEWDVGPGIAVAGSATVDGRADIAAAAWASASEDSDIAAAAWVGADSDTAAVSVGTDAALGIAAVAK